MAKTDALTPPLQLLRHSIQQRSVKRILKVDLLEVKEATAMRQQEAEAWEKKKKDYETGQQACAAAIKVTVTGRSLGSFGPGRRSGVFVVRTSTCTLGACEDFML